MPEIAIIDQYIVQPEDQGDVYNEYFLRLSVESHTDIVIGASVPQSLVIEEAFNQSIVKCKVVFQDLPGVLANVRLIEGDFSFKLYVGRSPENYQIYRMKLADIEQKNENPGESGNYSVELTLVSDFWQEMDGMVETRGWRNVRYSDVARDILERVGIENILVEQTKDSLRHVIKPNWTNHQMLEWMSKQSQTRTTDSHFVFGAIMERGFFFASFNDLMNGSINQILDFERIDPRSLVLSGEDPEGGNPNYRRLNDFRILNHYKKVMNQGASGIKYAYYDFNNRSYITDSHSISESDERQLTDWSLVSEGQETPSVSYYGHSNPLTSSIVKNKLSRENRHMQETITSMRGTTDIQVGEVVDVLIPLNQEFLSVPFNELHSGKYVVSAKRLIVDFDNGSALTAMRLERQGVNGVDVATLTSSTTGKVKVR